MNNLLNIFFIFSQSFLLMTISIDATTTSSISEEPNQCCESQSLIFPQQLDDNIYICPDYVSESCNYYSYGDPTTIPYVTTTPLLMCSMYNYTYGPCIEMMWDLSCMLANYAPQEGMCATTSIGQNYPRVCSSYIDLLYETCQNSSYWCNDLSGDVYCPSLQECAQDGHINRTNFPLYLPVPSISPPEPLVSFVEDKTETFCWPYALYNETSSTEIITSSLSNTTLTTLSETSDYDSDISHAFIQQKGGYLILFIMSFMFCL